jgi:hypothetical protein
MGKYNFAFRLASAKKNHVEGERIVVGIELTILTT